MESIGLIILLVHTFFAGIGVGLSIYMGDNWRWSVVTGLTSFVTGPWLFLYHRLLHHLITNNPRRIP